MRIDIPWDVDIKSLPLQRGVTDDIELQVAPSPASREEIAREAIRIVLLDPNIQQYLLCLTEVRIRIVTRVRVIVPAT
jgi:hypothetical protein